MPELLSKEIMDINAEQARLFVETIGDRRAYREAHPTEVAATMCMDGRINLRFITETPTGLITPFRNIGGRYDVGWPLMRETIIRWEAYSYKKRRSCLMVATYHFSEGDHHRGCAGFSYDTEAAKNHVFDFKAQMDRAFGDRINTIIMGIETDEEGIILHGEKEGQILLVEDNTDKDEKFFKQKIAEFFPSISSKVQADILPFLLGNAKHVEKIRSTGRGKHELVHGERVLALGQGFDWLDRQNFAIIIGPCDPDLGTAVAKAASIIADNKRNGRIPPEHGVLLVSTPFRNSEDMASAAEQSRFLARFAKEHIEKAIPDMLDFFVPLVGVVEMDSRKFIPVSEKA